jgi:hypothetical protein
MKMNPQVSTVVCEEVSPMLTSIIHYGETQQAKVQQKSTNVVLSSFMVLKTFIDSKVFILQTYL